MEIILMIAVGFVTGGVCTFFGLDRKRKQLVQIAAEQDAQIYTINNTRGDVEAQRAQLESDIAAKTAATDGLRARTIEGLKKQRNRVTEELKARQLEFEMLQNAATDAMRRRREEVDQQIAAAEEQLEERRVNAMKAIDEGQHVLNVHRQEFKKAEAEFVSRVIKYDELRDENALLKREFQNVGVRLNKSTLDNQAERRRNNQIAERVEELGGRYLSENVKWIGKSLNANNYAACKDRLLKVVERCRSIGFDVTAGQEETLIADLRGQYEMEVRAALEREEQARIRAQIREEQKREREIQKELERVERERSVLRAALEKALAHARDEHSAEIENLRARLADAEAREKAISQAQLTKAGFVYVISNIGSFGEGIFKIGMTRRLEPLDRVRELGDASVPFPFDVHMLVSCDDAPALESAVHRHLHRNQINRANPRKEFYRTDIETVAKIVQENHGDVQYIADAEALQYRQSVTMSEEDQEYIEHVFDDPDNDGVFVEDQM
jgi:regulator of replication initiation timing